MNFPVEITPVADSSDSERHRVDSLPILILHAHTSCNCRCVMCDIWKTRDSRSFTAADLEKLLPAIRELQVQWIVLSGGEPLLNPEWFTLCLILKGEGIRITLLTTGLLLEKYAAEVAAAFDEIIVSLDGPEQVHDEIRQINGAYALLRRGVAAVRRYRPSLRITARTTVQRRNHVHLQDTVAAAKQLNLDAISFLAADLTSEAFNRPSPWPVERQQDVGLSEKELHGLESEMETLLQTYAEEIACGFVAESPAKLRRVVRHFRVQCGLERAESPICNAPWVSAVVEADGTVRPCFFHRPIGSLRSAELTQIINSGEGLAFRSSLDVANNPICNRCVCSLNYRREETV